MKIHIDRKNNRVIANGYFRGKKIRTIAHCNRDTWNEAFGVSIATKKFDIKQEEVKKRQHERHIRKLHEMALWCYGQINAEQAIVSNLGVKIDKMNSEYQDFVKSHFEGEK